MRQLPFDFSGLVCALGEPWIGSHPLCDARGAVLVAQFTADVAAGRYDANGYTKAELAKVARKAQP